MISNTAAVLRAVTLCAAVSAASVASAGVDELPQDIQDKLYNPDLLDPNQPIGDSAYRDFVAKNPPPWTIGYASSYAGNTWRAAVMERLQNEIIPKWKDLGMLGEPGPHSGPIAGVCHDPDLCFEAICQEVVDDFTLVVAEAAVHGSPESQLAEIIGHHLLDKLFSLTTRHHNFRHVTEVEQARVSATGFVLFPHSGVLNRHLPTREIDHSGTRLFVYLGKWC